MMTGGAFNDKEIPTKNNQQRVEHTRPNPEADLNDANKFISKGGLILEYQPTSKLTRPSTSIAL